MTDNIKCKKAIAILSSLALACAQLYICSISRYPLYIESWKDIFSFFWVLLYIAPYILLIVYITGIHRQRMASAFYFLICILFALTPIHDMFISISGSFQQFLFDLLILVSLVLITISDIIGLKNKTKKIIVIIGASVGIAHQIYLAFYYIRYFSRHFNDKIYMLDCIRYVNILGTIALYVAFLLFALNNKILPLFAKAEIKESETMSPSQSLKLLQYKLELQLITEEEYQAQRADIISKL